MTTRMPRGRGGRGDFPKGYTAILQPKRRRQPKPSFSKPNSSARNGQNNSEIGGDMSETLFKQVQYDLQGLMSAVRMGKIGLPHIQREFIWKNTKVCDLFDSMYRGYPVSYLLLDDLPLGGSLCYHR